LTADDQTAVHVPENCNVTQPPMSPDSGTYLTATVVQGHYEL